MSVQSPDTVENGPGSLARQLDELSNYKVIEDVLNCLDHYLHDDEALESQPDFRQGLRWALIGSGCFWIAAALLIRSIV